jgi:phospholipid/cholesterol/gamma-HCH transport system permease protein
MTLRDPITLSAAAIRPIGRWAFLLAEAFSTPREFRKYRISLFRQMVEIGLASLPIVMLAAAFTGAVTTIQADYQFKSPLAPASGIGTVVTASVVLELGVLITVFILSGRVGARIAAELASMRIGEQIDALEVMGINAAGYLIVPRVVAGTVMFPLLYIAASSVAILAATLLAQSSDIITTEVFLKGARRYFEPYDVFYGLIKATVFGFILTSISCYKGYRAHGGAEGIGRSATRAAVLSSVYILFADYILAEVLL